MKRENIYRFLLSFVVAFIAGLQLLPYIQWKPYDLARYGLLIDDAYFYSVLAENLLKYHFLTFDGEMTTNGVQPLWMTVQAMLNMLFPAADSVRLLAFSSWLCYVLFAFTIVWYMNSISQPLANFLSTVTLAGLLILQYAFQDAVVRGLETPLMLLILTCTLLMLDSVRKKMREKTKKQVIFREVSLLALCTSLVFFSRTDLFWMAVVIFVWLLAIEKRISPNLILFASTVALLVIPYLAFNYFNEQSLMPISGRVKVFYMNTFFPDLQSYLRSDEWYGPYHNFDKVFLLNLLPVHKGIRFLLALIMMIAALFVVWRHRHSPLFPSSLKLLGIVVLLHLVYMQLFYRELRPYSAYYFTPEALFFGLTVACYVRKQFLCSDKGPKASVKEKGFAGYIRAHSSLAIVVLSAVIFSGAWIMYDLRPRADWIAGVNLAGDIASMVPEHEKVGAFWPGLFAQFSDRQIVPLDGIIGSNDYFQKYVKTGREIDYLLEKDIRFLAVYLPLDFDKLLPSDEAPKMNKHWHSWSRLGWHRLWENRHHITQILSVRPIPSSDAGWYLIEVSPTGSLEVGRKKNLYQ